MDFNKLIPEFSVFDIEKTVEFYQKIGFVIEYERKEDQFAFMSFQGTRFMFEQIHEGGWNTGILTYPLGRGANFSIAVEDIQRLYDKVKDENIEIYRELRRTSYLVNGSEEVQEEFLIQDPNGYLLRFTD